MDIIKALKENRYAFGIWPEPECYGKERGEEMQAKAREIGKDKFWLFVCQGDGFWKDYFDFRGDFNGSATYRLRDGYQEDAGVEKCEVRCNDSLELFYYRGRNGLAVCPLTSAPMNPDFIGYLYEDGWVSPQPRMYDNSVVNKKAIGFNREEDIDKNEVLTPTAVLFRKAKQ